MLSHDRPVVTCVRFLPVRKSKKYANRETTSCNHLGAFYLTCFARVCEIFTSAVSESQRGPNAVLLFRLVCLQKLMILFTPAKYGYNNSVSLNAFASKAASSSLIVGHSSNDLQIFIDRTFRASTSSFSAKHKLNSVFQFFFVRLMGVGRIFSTGGPLGDFS